MDLLEYHLLKKTVEGQMEFTLGTLFSILAYVIHVTLGIIELSIKAVIFLLRFIIKITNKLVQPPPPPKINQKALNSQI